MELLEANEQSLSVADNQTSVTNNETNLTTDEQQPKQQDCEQFKQTN